MHKKFEIHRTKIKGGFQSGGKMVTQDSKSDLPLVSSGTKNHVENQTRLHKITFKKSCEPFSPWDCVWTSLLRYLLILKDLSSRVIPLLSDLRAHQTTYSTNYLKWFFTKKIFWEMFPWTEIKIQSFKKQSSKKGLILIGFQKFFCVVNEHEESDFFVFWIF